MFIRWAGDRAVLFSNRVSMHDYLMFVVCKSRISHEEAQYLVFLRFPSYCLLLGGITVVTNKNFC